MGEGLLFLGLQLLLLSCELGDTNTAWHLLEPGTEPVVGPRQEQETVGESTTTVCCRPWSPAWHSQLQSMPDESMGSTCTDCFDRPGSLSPRPASMELRS